MLFINPIIHKITWNHVRYRTDIVGFVPECNEEELARMDILDAGESSDETDEGADHAAGRLGNVDWCSSCAAPLRPPPSTS